MPAIQIPATGWELTHGDTSEIYPTWDAARAAQQELNRLGLIGSSIDHPTT